MYRVIENNITRYNIQLSRYGFLPKICWQLLYLLHCHNSIEPLYSTSTRVNVAASLPLKKNFIEQKPTSPFHRCRFPLDRWFRKCFTISANRAGWLALCQANHYTTEYPGRRISEANPEYLLRNPDGTVPPLEADRIVREITEIVMGNAQTNIDAACLVFAHSVMDAATIDYLDCTIAAASQDWEPQLKINLCPSVKRRF
jgi:hypothetical protein